MNIEWIKGTEIPKAMRRSDIEEFLIRIKDVFEINGHPVRKVTVRDPECIMVDFEGKEDFLSKSGLNDLGPQISSINDQCIFQPGTRMWVVRLPQ